ncbi:MAG: hypothetical protein HY854_13455 [Burkholderiales bacterium]|nr:hypothetical protein [Burkholderiales bacterium]
MAARSSASTKSPSTSMGSRSQRSRSELHYLNDQAKAGASNEPRQRRDPKDKKHQSLEEVRQKGRQSDRGSGRK